METILITGGTGLLGRALVKNLMAKGYSIIILTRNLKDHQPEPQVEYAEWDVKKQTIDINALTIADHIIHLAGAGVVEKKWTTEYKKEIVESRTESSRLLVDSLGKCKHRVKTIVSASAIGWYGEDQFKNKAFTEDDPADNSFLGETCRLWEESISKAESLNIRVCKIRIGILLSTEGGAYPEFAKPVKFGLATVLGTGMQMVSWVHIDDVCRIFIAAIENHAMSGSYNAVAPNPVTNKILMQEIGKSIKGKAYMPVHVPRFMLKIMMGQRSIEILKSATVSSTKIKATGFNFLYPTLTAALNELEKKS